MKNFNSKTSEQGVLSQHRAYKLLHGVVVQEDYSLQKLLVGGKFVEDLSQSQVREPGND